MKKNLLSILQWLHSLVFLLFAYVNGLNISSAFLVLAAILMMPIKPLRVFLDSRNIKGITAVILSVGLLLIGIVASPMASPAVQDQDGDVIETTWDSGGGNPKETEDIATSTPAADEPAQSLDDIIASIIAGSVKEIPGYYSGEAYVVVNDNVPYFTPDQLITTSFEYYSELDSLERCGTVAACIGIDLMPTEDRGDIGMVKPTGWHTVKYDSVDGKYLYNRCHLIGFQLTGENANTKNLVTGTRYMNVDGMLPFENMVADYVKETNNHVLYRVTPVFDGDDLLCSGVIMEAYSVEDNGEGICFNVYCFNAQPDISINYADGSSFAAVVIPPETSAVTETEPVTEEPATEEPVPEPEPEPEPAGTDYIVNTNKTSRKFHYPNCHSVDLMNEENKWYYTGTREDLISRGYSPCGNCNP